MLNPVDIDQVIDEQIKEISSSSLKSWFVSHRKEPEKITLHHHTTNKPNVYWLISDHVGHNDSNYRIVHCQKKKGLFA